MYKLFISRKLNSKSLIKYIKDLYKIDDELMYNEYGLPYFKNNKIYFNISNKDDITICGVSNTPIGVDIESIKINHKIIKKICNDKEIIKNEHDFTITWVKKEAYSKYLGIGLSYGFKNIDTTKLHFLLTKYDNYYICVYLDNLKKDGNIDLLWI